MTNAESLNADGNYIEHPRLRPVEAIPTQLDGELLAYRQCHTSQTNSCVTVAAIALRRVH